MNKKKSYYSRHLLVSSNASLIPLDIPIMLHTTDNSILGDINLDGLINYC